MFKKNSLIVLLLFYLFPCMVNAQQLDGAHLVYELISASVRDKYNLPKNDVQPGSDKTSTEYGVNSHGLACRILVWDRKGFNKPYLPISESGNYCLDQDYELTCSFFSHGCGGNLLEIRAENVDVDFLGHTLHVRGTRAFGGIWGYGKNITVHGGTISGAGVGVLLMQQGGFQTSPIYAGPEFPAARGVFSKTDFIVHSMKFVDVHSPILLSGSGNVISKNTFELAGADRDDGKSDVKKFSAAVVSYGGHVRIEENHISANLFSQVVPGYVFYLRSGDNSIVVNNEFSLGFAGRSKIAIGLNASENVTVERNSFGTLVQKIEIGDRSSISEQLHKE